MTKQEFDALGITKYDLVIVFTKDSITRRNGSKGYVCYLSPPYYLKEKLMVDWLDVENHKYCLKITVQNIISIEILRKNFWSES